MSYFGNKNEHNKSLEQSALALLLNSQRQPATNGEFGLMRGVCSTPCYVHVSGRVATFASLPTAIRKPVVYGCGHAKTASQGSQSNRDELKL